MYLDYLSLNFPNKEGFQLSARLDMPEDPIAFGIYAHCFTCTKNITAAHVICKTLAENGIAMLRFDFMGLGESEGDFFESSLTGNVTDILAASDFLTKEFQSPKILIGHSLGGLAGLYAAKKIESLKCCFTLNAPSSTRHTRKRLMEESEMILHQGYATLDILGKHYKINPSFADDLKLYEDLNLTDLNAALFVMHVPTDPIVPIAHAEYIFKSAQHPKSFISLDGMDHLFKDRKQAEDVAGIIFGCAKRYL